MVAYGVWFYGAGVLIEPIVVDTGWAESAVSAAYGISLLLTGVGATIAGRVLDRRGSRALFIASAIAGGPLLFAASTVGGAWQFTVLAAIGGGAIGAGGYYPATQAVAARIVPEQRARAITRITLWGAFASAIFLPAIGRGLTVMGWRPMLRILAVIITLAFVAVIALVPNVRPAAVERAPMRQILAREWSRRAPRRMLIAAAASGVMTSTLLLFQVPTMVSAGLALVTATTVAGARGLLQLGGRLPLGWFLDRFPARRLLRFSYLLTAVGAAILPFTGSIVVAGAFATVAGVSIGALAALEGIYATEIFASASLGTSMGAMALIRGVGAAAGPVIAGLLADVTGSRIPGVVLAGAAALVAAAILPVGDDSAT